MSFESNIKELKLVLPKASDPVGSYVAFKIINIDYVIKYNILCYNKRKVKWL